MVNTYVIPDIHGNLSLLETLLGKLPLSDGDRIITLGDYIDRGPASKEVIDLLISLKSRFEMVYLMGNHEQIFVEYLKQGKVLRKLTPEYRKGRGKDGLKDAGRVFHMARTGGIQTLLSYGYTPDVDPRKIRLPDTHLEFFGEMQLCWHNGVDLLVHAGVCIDNGAPLVSSVPEILKLSSVRDLLWSRELVKQPHLEANWNFRVICGHTPQASGLPLVTERVVCLDVGAAYDVDLCALSMETGSVYFARRLSPMSLAELR